MQSSLITHGRTEGGRSSWTDHVLYKRNLEHVSVLGACNALGEELNDISDHNPLWGLYLTAPPLAARHVRVALIRRILMSCLPVVPNADVVAIRLSSMV